MKKILPVIATSVFLLTFGGAGSPGEIRQGPEHTVYGTISRVTPSSGGKRITLETDGFGASAEPHELTVLVTGKTIVLVCTEPRLPDDLRPGTRAVVTYRDDGGQSVAEFIYIPC